MPQEDPRRRFYDAVSEHVNIGSYDSYLEGLNDPQKRLNLFNGISENFDIGEFEAWEDKLMGFQKPTINVTPNIPLINLSGTAPLNLQAFYEPDFTPGQKLNQIYDSGAKTLVDMGTATVGALLYNSTDFRNALYFQAGVIPIISPEQRAFEKQLTEENKRTAMNFVLDAQNWSEVMFPGVKGLEDSFLFSKLPSGYSSMVGFLAMTAATRGMGVSAWLSAGITGALVEMGLMGAEAYDMTGGDISITDKTMAAAIPIGFTEALPISRLFGRIDKLTGKSFTKIVKGALAEGFEEGSQELVQQLAENFTAQELYDANRILDEGLVEGAAIGFITGSSLAAGGLALKRKQQGNKEDEAISKATIEINKRGKSLSQLNDEESAVKLSGALENQNLGSQVIKEVDFYMQGDQDNPISAINKAVDNKEVAGEIINEIEGTKEFQQKLAKNSDIYKDSTPSLTNKLTHQELYKENKEIYQNRITSNIYKLTNQTVELENKILEEVDVERTENDQKDLKTNPSLTETSENEVTEKNILFDNIYTNKGELGDLVDDDLMFQEGNDIENKFKSRKFPDLSGKAVYDPTLNRIIFANEIGFLAEELMPGMQELEDVGGHDVFFQMRTLLEGDIGAFPSNIPNVNITLKDNEITLTYDPDKFLRETSKIDDKFVFNKIFDAVKALKREGFNGNLRIPELKFIGSISKFLGEDITLSFQADNEPFKSARNVKQNGYEVSTAGDKRFSALNARLADGRTIEEAYQIGVKGYSSIKEGKGKPPKDTSINLYAEYKKLWQQWAIENPNLIAELAEKARGKTLTDKFANTNISQARALAEILNERVSKPIQKSSKNKSPLIKIISGGQIGADRAGLEAGKQLKLETGGTAPKGFRISGGTAPDLANFGLIEDKSTSFSPRTKKNVLNSDGTVLFGTNMNSPGSKLTIKLLKENNKPFIINPSSEKLRNFINENNIQTLNVAGNRNANVANVIKTITNAVNVGLTQKSIPGTYGELLTNVGLESVTTVEAANNSLEKDPLISDVIDWIVEQEGIKDTRIFQVDKDFKIGDGRTLDNRKGFYKKKTDTGEDYIGINRSVRSDKNSDPYNTVAHEIFHKFSNDKLKTDRQFRANIVGFMTNLRNDLENRGNFNSVEEVAFESPEEFLSHIVSNTAPALRKYIMDQNIPNTQTRWIQWLQDIFRTLYSKIRGVAPRTWYDGLEILLKKHLGIPTTFKGIPVTDVENAEFDELIDKELGNMDKSFMISEGGLDDPRVIITTAKILAEDHGMKLIDMYGFIKKLSLDPITDKKEHKDNLWWLVKNSPTWQTRSLFYYQTRFTDKFDTYEDYERAIIKNLWAYAQTLEQVPMVRLTVTTDFEYRGDPKPTRTNNIVELGIQYRDKDGRSLLSYQEHMKIMDTLPLLNKTFGTEFELQMVEQIHEVNLYDNSFNDKWYSLNSSQAAVRDNEGNLITNEHYAQIFESQGYIFLGTWSDKKTVLILKPKTAIPEESIQALRGMYSKKAEDLGKTLFVARNNKAGRDGNAIVQNLEELASATNVPLSELIQNEDPEIGSYMSTVEDFAGGLQSPVVRLALEDIRMGGLKQGVTALYNPDDANTYDSIKMFKRPYLISRTRAVYQNEKEINILLKNIKLKHGMFVRDGELITTAMVFNDNVSRETTFFTYKGEQYDIGEILLNSIGTETQDGKIFYVLDGFDKIWRQLHGSLQSGTIKAWIGQSFTNEDFSNPFYVKGAYHGINKNEILAEWMQENGITLLISESAAKINNYATSQIGGEINTLEIPFKEIQHDKEKSKAKDGAKGLMQTITANYISPANEGFVDVGWDDMIDKVINSLSDSFTDVITSMNPMTILEYMKDKAMVASSDYERTISGLILDLAMTVADRNYRNLKDHLNSNNEVISGEARKRALETLDKYKTQKIRVTRDMANRISNIFHEPYFAKPLKEYINRELEKITKWKVPGTWATLDSDAGFLTQQRYETAIKYAGNIYEGDTKRAYIKASLNKFNELQNAIKILGEEFETIDAVIRASNTKEDIQIKLVKQKQTIIKEQAEIEEQIELIGVVDDLGTITIDFESSEFNEFKNSRKDKRKEFIDKKRSEWFDNVGRLKQGFMFITQDIADIYKISEGDSLVHVAVPSDSLIGANASIVIGVLGLNLSEPGKIVLNSEYIQSIIGKDFDIDTMLLIPKSDHFTDETYSNLVTSLQLSLEKHKKLITAEYRKQLGGYTFQLPKFLPNQDNKIELQNVEVKGKDLVFEDTLNSNVRLEYTKKQNGVNLGKQLFNPLTEGFKILNQYHKDIGKIVNRRKLLTMKSQIGLRSNIKTSTWKMTINPNHKDRWTTYNLLLNMTNDMVDMPTNTNKFFYKYNNIQAYDQDNGTNFIGLIDNGSITRQSAENIVKALVSIEKFLFGYGTRLSTDYNLDTYGEKRGLDEDLGYIRIQKQINQLLEKKTNQQEFKGNKKELYRLYQDQWLANQKKLNPGSRNYQKQLRARIGHLRVVKQYLDNLIHNGLEKSPMLKLINKFDLDLIPAIETTEEKYRLTQYNLVNNLLNRPEWKSIKQRYLDTIQGFSTIIDKVPPGNVKHDGFVNNNKQAAMLHFLTGHNRDLHYLKARVITLINPVNQTTKKPTKQYGPFIDSIYQKANEESYPTLIKILFENNKTVEFHRGDVNKIEFNTPLGKIVFKRGTNEVLIIENNGSKYNPGQISAGISQKATKLREYIYGDLFKDANNRILLTNLIQIGGKHTPLQQRIAAASELLNQELEKFSEMDRILFWTSLLGHPTYNIKHAMNLVNPFLGKGVSKSWTSHDRLLQLLHETNDPKGKNFLKIYAEEFHKAYEGPNWDESMRISQLILREDVFNNENQIEMWFQNDRKRSVAELRKDIDTELNTKFEGLLSMYEIIDFTKKRKFKTNTIVGNIPNLTNGVITKLVPLDVIKSVSPYETETEGPINETMIVFTKALKFQQVINHMYGLEDIRDNVINDYLNQITVNTLAPLKSYKSKAKTQAVEQQLIDIHNLVEKNPFNITIGTALDGSYVYKARGEETGFSNPRILLENLGVINEHAMLKHLTAIKLHERYSVDNLKYLERMLEYFENISDDIDTKFPGYSGKTILTDMLKKYRGRINQFKAQKFHYIPRVYKRKDWIEAQKEENREIVEKLVRDRVEVNRKIKEDGNKYFTEPYASLITEEQIQKQIEKELTQFVSNIIYNNFGGYVHSWELKRQIIPIHEGYVKNDMSIHQKHTQQFFEMFKNDFMALDWFLYEHHSHATGVPQKTINRVKRWYNLTSNHPLIKSDPIETQNIKPKDRVQFYIQQKNPDGTFKETFLRAHVDRIEGNNLFLEIPKNEMIGRIEGDLTEIEAEEAILENNDKRGKTKLTELQHRKLVELFKNGYNPKAPGSYRKNKTTRLEANNLLKKHLTAFLNDSGNWGRYNLDKIYIKQYDGPKTVFKNGVRREPGFDPAIWGDLRRISAMTMISWFPGAVKNYNDARWALMRDLRTFNFLKTKKMGWFEWISIGAKSREFKGEFKVAKKNIEISEGLLPMLKKAEAVNARLLSTMTVGQKEEYVKAFATEYAVENRLGRLDNLGNMILNDPGDIKGLEEWRAKISGGLRALSGSKLFGVGLFMSVEANVRLKSAYMYSYKAVIIDKVTDPNQIRGIIEKGVARTQSLYENFYRRLAEDSSLGKLLLQFTQFNSFQAEITKMSIQQASRLGQTKLTSFGGLFTENITIEGKTYNSTDSIDPNLLNRGLVNWWIDSVGFVLGILIPGFRAGRPLAALSQKTLRILAYTVVNGANLFDEDEEWDTRDWFFSFLSFFAGVGITIPIQLMANLSAQYGYPIPLLSTKQEDLLDIIPINPRQSYTAIELAKALKDLPETITQQFSGEAPMRKISVNGVTVEIPWHNAMKSKFKQAEIYELEKLEKGILSLNFFVPRTRNYQGSIENEFQSLSPEKKIWFLFTHPDIYIPVYNILKYGANIGL